MSREFRSYFLSASCVLFGLLALAGCSQQQPSGPAKEQKSAEPAPPPLPPPAPTRVRFTSSKGDFVMEVHKEWAPLGAERFLELVKAGFYNESRFFRVVPNFVVQFGLAANPAVTKKWDQRIDDDPVLRTNRVGSVAFATNGPNTRTTQVFINLRGNQVLDEKGFAPFAQVVEGMEVVEKLYSGYGERPDQEQIRRQGNKYLIENYPNLDYIKRAVIE